MTPGFNYKFYRRAVPLFVLNEFRYHEQAISHTVAASVDSKAMHKKETEE
jgi:hypothetical protein